MKRLLAILSLAILIFAATSAGCMNFHETKKTATPEATWETYVAAFNRGDSDTVYNLLSNEVKSKETKDFVHNTVKALSDGRLRYDSYKIGASSVTGDTATLEVEITISVQGYHLTKVHTLDFIKDGNDWKLQKFYTPSSA